MCSIFHSPAAQRNSEPILEILQKYLSRKEPLHALEISSGGGTHVVLFAQHFPNISWQPSEFDEGLIQNIQAFAEQVGVNNVKRPVFIDISRPVSIFERESFNIIVNINLTHISPYRCTEGLFEAAGTLLRRGGRMFMYGPFAENGVLSPESNVNFDKILRGQNSEWGIRDVKDLNDEACKNNMCLEASHDMPANNKTLVWKKL